MNKVRIIALYIQHRDGVPDEDRRRLYQHARLTMAEQDAVNALVQLGVRISRVGHDVIDCVVGLLGRTNDRNSNRAIKTRRRSSSKSLATTRNMSSHGISLSCGRSSRYDDTPSL